MADLSVTSQTTALNGSEFNAQSPVVSRSSLQNAENNQTIDNNALQQVAQLVASNTNGVSRPYTSDFRESYPQAQGLKFSETKGASGIAYAGKTGDRYTFPDGKQWQVTNTHVDDNTAFRAVVLKPLDKNDDRRILAFAGTDVGTSLAGAIKDVWTDGKQVWGLRPTQLRQAAELAGKYKAQFGDNLTLTGHSLGGGMASYAALKNDLRATGVNAAPLQEHSNIYLGDIDIPDKYLKPINFGLGIGFREDINIITHYNVPGEFVSGSEVIGFGAQPGGEIKLKGGDRSLLAPLNNHFLNNAGPEVPEPKLVK